MTRTTSLRCEVEIICDSIAAWYALHHAFTGRLSLGVDTTAQAALRAPDWRRSDAPLNWAVAVSGSSGQPHGQLSVGVLLGNHLVAPRLHEVSKRCEPSDFSVKAGSIRYIWLLTPAA